MRLPFSVSFALEHLTWNSIRERFAAQRLKNYPLLPRGATLSRQITIVQNADEARKMFLETKSPLVWKQGAVGTSLDNWSLAHLRKRAGTTPVKILTLDGLDGVKTVYSDQTMPLSRYIELLKRNDVYLRFSDLLDNAPDLRRELPLDLLQQIGNKPGRTNLQFFLGPGGTHTPLHAEMNCNIFVQVFGRKRWVIFPPSATKQLQPPSARRFYFFSPLNALKLAGTRAENGALEGTEIILDPGDILLCPPLVWHTAENLSVSCSVGFKFNRYFQAFNASPLLFLMNMLARNPSYITYIWHALVRKRHPILSTK